MMAKAPTWFPLPRWAFGETRAVGWMVFDKGGFRSD
jgi:hypothetical protein